jgi:hypothetical protein
MAPVPLRENIKQMAELRGNEKEKRKMQNAR